MDPGEELHQRLPFPLIDFHTHLTTSILSTQGVERLVHLMDLFGVASTVGFAFPFVTVPRGRWPYTARGDSFALRCARAHPGRIVPFLCGFDPTDEGSIEYVERNLSSGGGFRGVGELLVGKEEWRGRLGGGLRVDHPVAVEIYGRAGAHRVPVLVHCDASLRGEFERAIDACPETAFVWAHCGAARGWRQGLAEIVEGMLAGFPHLHCDLSWDVWDIELLEPGSGGVRACWMELLERWPERFLAGFDLCGEFASYPLWVERFRRLLLDLPRDLAGALSMGNAERLLGMSAER